MSPTRLSNLTIVVEDHNDTRSFLGIFLSHLGAKVVVAEADPSTRKRTIEAALKHGMTR